MVHFGFPRSRTRHQLDEEGIATYVDRRESFHQHLAPEQVWAKMLRDMPKGCQGRRPRARPDPALGEEPMGRRAVLSDGGRQDSPTNGNTRDSDALRPINRAGGHNRGRMAFGTRDRDRNRATGGGTLMQLYQDGFRAMAVDLDHCGNTWGEAHRTGSVDDQAPLGAIRGAILAALPARQVSPICIVFHPARL